METSKLVNMVVSVLMNNMTLFYIGSVLCAVMGLVYDPLFFSFHLLDVLNRSNHLKNVISAVTTNGRSLTITALFGLIITYLYSIIGFLFFRMYFSDTGASCNTLLFCWVATWNNGLRHGDIGGELVFGEQLNSWVFVGFVAFEFSFFVLVITILLNLIFGIIVDTFGALRERQATIEEDMKNKCFICSIDSYMFNRYGDGFDRHIKFDHYMWNYLYLMVHLHHKDVMDFTGWESSLFKKMLLGDYSFFPINKAAILLASAKEDDQVQKHITQSVTSIKTTIQEQQVKVEIDLHRLDSDMQHVLKFLSKMASNTSGGAVHENTPTITTPTMGSKVQKSGVGLPTPKTASKIKKSGSESSIGGDVQDDQQVAGRSSSISDGETSMERLDLDIPVSTQLNSQIIKKEPVKSRSPAKSDEVEAQDTESSQSSVTKGNRLPNFKRSKKQPQQPSPSISQISTDSVHML